MKSPEQLDFSKAEDQEKFDNLSKEEKKTRINDVLADAYEMNADFNHDQSEKDSINIEIEGVKCKISPWCWDNQYSKGERLFGEKLVDFVKWFVEKSDAQHQIKKLASDVGSVEDIIIENEDEWLHSNGEGELLYKDGTKVSKQVSSDMNMAHSYNEIHPNLSVWSIYRRVGDEIRPEISVMVNDGYNKEEKRSKARRINIEFIKKIEKQ